MKKLHRLLYGAGLLAISLGACKKMDLAPTDRFTDLNYWTSTTKASEVLNMAYSQMMNNDRFFYNEGLSDNAYVGRGDNQGALSISNGTYDPSLGRLKSEWDDRYGGIKTTNVFLENVDRVPDMDETLRTRMKAEARFLRAFQYFQLYTWFGDIPFFTSDISIAESRTIARTPRATVVDFVLKELDAVAAVLPNKQQYDAADAGRITSGAAIALKARVLLYENRYPEVAAECEKLMGGNYGHYDLFANYEGVFLPQNENNIEDVLDLQYVPEVHAYSNYFDLAPLSAGARDNAMAPLQELVDDYVMLNGKGIKESGSGYDENHPYQNRDPRMGTTIVYDGYAWKKPDGSTQTIYIKPGSDPDQSKKLDEYGPGRVSSPTGYYMRKYYDPQGGNNFLSGLNLILIRWADVLLMYAEAKNEQGQMTQEIWNNTIGKLRTRAGFTDAAAINYNAAWTQADLQSIIRRERRSELAMEGLRIFDIRRWKTAEKVLNGWAHGARFGDASIDNGYIRVAQRTFDAKKHYLWPVPRDERALDPNLGQNANW